MKLWAKILITVLVLVLLGGGIFGIVKLADEGKLDSKKISSLAYGIGGLDGSGKYMNTDQSIYTKDAFECQGLNCTLVFDNDISYQIYFYDQNNDFVHTTGKLTGAFVQDSVPFFAKYARIVITPNDDNKVSLLEVTKYAKQLKTTVYREQGFKNYTENLIDFDAVISGYKLNATGDELVEEANSCVIDYINVSGYKGSMVFSEAGLDGINLFFYDRDKEPLGAGTFNTIATETFTASTGYKYYSIDFDSLDDDLVFVRFKVGTSHLNSTGFYCR